MLLEIVIIFAENLRPLNKKLFLVKYNDFNQEINLRNIFMVNFYLMSNGVFKYKVNNFLHDL
jgi:hypothetical protein